MALGSCVDRSCPGDAEAEPLQGVLGTTMTYRAGEWLG